MKNLKLLFLFSIFIFSQAAFSLEEPPGTIAQTEEEAIAYLNQLKKDRGEGKIHMEPGIEKSWINAEVYVPNNFFPKKITNLTLDKKYPVIIYLHGCSGITGNHDSRWGKFLSESGFVVILPDSLSRPGRISNCDPQNSITTNRFPMALPFREQEIAFALNQLRKTSWADMSNIYLMGHSEGANAAARTQITGLKGIILSSGFCQTGVIFEKGIKALVINFSNDPWHQGNKSNCLVERADNSIQLLLIPATGHSTFDNESARTQVINFLKAP